jgi:RNA polymerase sigma factor (sigma-70 family)
MPIYIDNSNFRKLLSSMPEKAIALLYDICRKPLVNIAWGLIHDRSAAEDIVQETFIYIWQNANQFSREHERSIHHLLVRIVTYKSITYYKKNVRLTKRKSLYLNGFHHHMHVTPEFNLIQNEILDEIHQTIATFPRREKQCLNLRIEEGLTTSEIASKLNISKKAVERSLTSANKRLIRYRKSS